MSASSFVPPTHFQTVSAIIQWGQDVEKATEGRVKMNLLPKAVVAPPGTLDAVRDGLVDIAWTVHGLTSSRFVLTNIAELPGNGDNAEATSVAYQRVHERHLAKAGEHKGLRVLALWTHGPGVVHTTKKPITTLNDLVGLKIRSPGGMMLEISKALGVVAVLTPSTEVYEMLSGGIVDGVFFPVDSVASFKLERLIKHVIEIPGGLYNSSFVLMMNEGRFNSLPKRDQDAINAVSGEVTARRVGRSYDAQKDNSLASMKAAGAAFATASPEFMQSLKAKTAAIEAGWIKEANARGVDGAKAIADFRAEVAKELRK
ncbi:MAG: TRAP transporter substrate-binding protein [Betaproteobacteria bacterium]|nr:TRAP transporter substrate-binding protein [Betaproteobacteria bacterium]